MRHRLLVPLLLAISCFSLSARRLQAQQPATQETASQHLADEDERRSTERWKLINTGIFALLIGFALIKYAPAFFQSRSLDIQKAIKDATGLKIEADFRYSEIDKRMANLPAEVERIKAEAAAEMEREHQRLEQETADELAHITRNVDFEIDYLRNQGALQVKQHTAQLAFALAERRLQSHFSQDDGQRQVREFVALVSSDNKSGGRG